MDFPYQELIGAVAYGIAIAGFMSHSDRALKLCVIAACSINAVYFSTHGMYITAMVLGLTVTRIAVSMRTSDWRVGVVFIAATLCTPLVAPSQDVLAVAAGVLGTIAVFWCTGVPMRLVLLGNTACLLINNLLGGAWAGVAGEAVILAVALWRIQVMTRNRPTKDPVRSGSDSRTGRALERDFVIRTEESEPNRA